MVSRICRTLLLTGGGLVILGLAGCGTGDDNSPSMGKVAPKPNPNMNAQLPQAIRDQMAQAKPGADASRMGAMRSHGSRS